MGSLAPHIVAGIVLVLVLDHFSLFAGVGSNPHGSAAHSSDVIMSINSADRPGKGNRLVPRRLEIGQTDTIVAVEIVGLHDASIVYRAREGRALFHNDPLTNTTIVAKNVVLPEVTIRDRNDIAVRPKPVEPSPKAKAERPKLPVGCDSNFGPLADPSLRVVTGRCLTENARVPRFAALW